MQQHTKWFITAAICIVILGLKTNSAHANEAYIGLKTYHFERGGRNCLNETHNLVAYDSGNWHVGTYENSQCRRSYLIGTSYAINDNWGFDASLVTGYPSSMNLIEGIRVTLIPMFTYKNYWGHVGIKVIHVPTVLIGIGVAIKL